MTREAYQETLAELRTEVREMGDLVVGQLDDALAAHRRRDDELARTVISGDAEINRRYLALEKSCIDLIALQQPLAGDLRLVAASFKILTDLERVGDIAADLARYGLAAQRSLDAEADVYEIGADSRAMLVDALDAYTEKDVDTCYEIAERDDELDAESSAVAERLVRDLIETELREPSQWELERYMDDVTRLLLTIRDLERVGDHAVNVAGRTLYMAESDPMLI